MCSRVGALTTTFCGMPAAALTLPLVGVTSTRLHVPQPPPQSGHVSPKSSFAFAHPVGVPQPYFGPLLVVQISPATHCAS